LLEGQRGERIFEPRGSRGLVLSDLIVELLSRVCGISTNGMHDEPPGLSGVTTKMYASL